MDLRICGSWYASYACQRIVSRDNKKRTGVAGRTEFMINIGVFRCGAMYSACPRNTPHTRPGRGPEGKARANHEALPLLVLGRGREAGRIRASRSRDIPQRIRALELLSVPEVAALSLCVEEELQQPGIVCSQHWKPRLREFGEEGGLTPASGKPVSMTFEPSRSARWSRL